MKDLNKPITVAGGMSLRTILKGAAWTAPVIAAAAAAPLAAASQTGNSPYHWGWNGGGANSDGKEITIADTVYIQGPENSGGVARLFGNVKVVNSHGRQVFSQEFSAVLPEINGMSTSPLLRYQFTPGEGSETYTVTWNVTSATDSKGRTIPLIQPNFINGKTYEVQTWK